VDTETAKDVDNNSLLFSDGTIVLAMSQISLKSGESIVGSVVVVNWQDPICRVCFSFIMFSNVPSLIIVVERWMKYSLPSVFAKQAELE
jgi:hypothetical protein